MLPFFVLFCFVLFLGSQGKFEDKVVVSEIKQVLFIPSAFCTFMGLLAALYSPLFLSGVEELLQQTSMPHGQPLNRP